MRKWTLVVGGLVVGLGLAEGVCRLTLENPITGAGENRSSWRVEGLLADPELDFSFIPGYAGRMTLTDEYDVPFRINGQGLRDDHDYAPEHPGTRRILLVGDSFVFGIGVELPDTLGRQLQRALNEDGSDAPPVEVVAAGVPSYSLDSYAHLIERWVPRLHPDLVVVAMFPGNDLVDYDLKATDPPVVIETRLTKQRQAWNWGLRKYSLLAHVLLQRFNPFGRVDRYRPLKPTPQDLVTMYRSMVPWIERIAAAPGPGGPPVAVWVLHGREVIPIMRASRGPSPVPMLPGVLAEFRRLGVGIVDPTEMWIDAPPPIEQYFFKVDAHYSALGNRLMADWLARKLREMYGQALGAGAADHAGTASPPAR